MELKLPELPFAVTDLDPFMSAETLDYHHGKHHKKYVDKANELIKGTEYEHLDSEIEIFLTAWEKNLEIFNNSAQAWNHKFFWQCLGKDSTPSDFVKGRLKEEFGSPENLAREFNDVAVKIFGSGWAWLVLDSRGRLKIRGLKDAENPLIFNEFPVLTCDVWEHAYYLDYRNDRARFLENFWNIVQWSFVEQNLKRTTELETEKEVNP